MELSKCLGVCRIGYRSSLAIESGQIPSIRIQKGRFFTYPVRKKSYDSTSVIPVYMRLHVK